MNSLLLVLVVLAAAPVCTAARVPAVESDVTRVLHGFFSLFTWPCDKWVFLFSSSASFSHPKFPHGVVGTDQLTAFCVSAQGNSSSQQLFRADGPARITQTELSVHVLVPYVWSAPLNGPQSPPFVNSGWEMLELVSGAQGLVIAAVTEFFNSNRTQL